MKLKVALDIDDVLARFFTSFCRVLGTEEVKCDIWNPEEIGWDYQAYEGIKNDVTFWDSIKPLSSPDSITFEVAAYITAAPKESKRHVWLERHGFPVAPVYYTHNKIEMMRNLGIKVIVDDRPDFIDAVNMQEDLIGLQFKPGYMSADSRDKNRIITHLSEVNSFLDAYPIK